MAVFRAAWLRSRFAPRSCAENPPEPVHPEAATGSTAGASRRGKFYPTVLQAIGLLVFTGVVRILFDIPVWISTRAHTASSSVAMAVGEALSPLSLVVGLSYLSTASPFRDVFPLRRFRLSLVIPMVLMLLGTIIIAAEINFVFRMAFLKPESFKQAESSVLDGGFWVAFLTLVVVGLLGATLFGSGAWLFKRLTRRLASR
jgi:hypothetical protein